MRIFLQRHSSCATATGCCSLTCSIGWVSAAGASLRLAPAMPMLRSPSGRAGFYSGRPWPRRLPFLLVVGLPGGREEEARDLRREEKGICHYERSATQRGIFDGREFPPWHCAGALGTVGVHRTTSCCTTGFRGSARRIRRTSLFLA